MNGRSFIGLKGVIHRACIVNPERIAILKDGTRIPVSRSGLARLKCFL
jgi:hypothetical protein